MPNNDNHCDSACRTDGGTADRADEPTGAPDEATGGQEAVTGAPDEATGGQEPATGAPDEATEGQEALTAADEPGAVVLRATTIEKTYESLLPFRRSVAVLDGADIELRAGEIVGIVGENGSGKSTLMKVLVGALAPDGGTVEQLGTVGWCPQEPLLYERLTVAETFELFGRAYGLTAAEIDDARDRLADRLDFERFLDYRVDRLSGGNRQKVNLAVALMHDPDVLLLDEPYTGFDWETYLAFWDLTEDLTDRGTAIAIISHFVSEQERFDRIYELADGTLSVRAAGADRGPVDAGVGPAHRPDADAATSIDAASEVVRE